LEGWCVQYLKRNFRDFALGLALHHEFIFLKATEGRQSVGVGTLQNSSVVRSLPKLEHVEAVVEATRVIHVHVLNVIGVILKRRRNVEVLWPSNVENLVLEKSSVDLMILVVNLIATLSLATSLGSTFGAVFSRCLSLNFQLCSESLDWICIIPS
jgi:hypothetical protein